MRLKPDEILLVRGGLGRYHRVTAVFTHPDSANAYLASNPTESVITAFSHMILLANTSDLGISIPKL